MKTQGRLSTPARSRMTLGGAAMISVGSLRRPTLTRRKLALAWLALVGAVALGASGSAACAAPHSSFAGVWDTSDDSFNTMTLRRQMADVEDEYTFKDGRIWAEPHGRTLTGYWVQSSSSQQCATSKLGSQYWGRIAFTLSAKGRSFYGVWGYCDADPTVGMTGTRSRR
ncbi:MAG: hypothetical protein ACHP84_08070 [Caulobacterales bacterium]